MYHDMGWGSGWFSMIPTMLLWLIVLVVLVYAAVRLAMRHSDKSPVS